MINTYLLPLKKAFEKNADPEYSFGMKKYMRNKFDYYGIKSELRKKLSKNFLKTYGLPDKDSFVKIIKDLWNLPQREYQYFALELLEKMRKKIKKEHIEVIEYLIIEKSWWDSVDGLAANVVGKFFSKYPELINDYTEKWMTSGNIWLQRTCLLFQLKYKNNTDLDLLFKFINRLSGSKEFFIQKAIGWVLREYSKTNPKIVIDFVENNTLANLSKREALKVIKRKNPEILL